MVKKVPVYDANLTEFIISLTSLPKLPNTLIKLRINVQGNYIPLSFLTKFTNLQEFEITLDSVDKALRYVTFPQLQILKCRYLCTKHTDLIKFLENNGKNLKEISFGHSVDSLNLAIAKFCPNLKLLYTRFLCDEVETLKGILVSCQQLERIKVDCGDGLLNENELLKVIVKFSPKKFHELTMYCLGYKELFSEKLEPIFASWAKRIPPKSFSLIIMMGFLSNTFKKENMEVIENFKKLGVIKKFEIFPELYI